VEIRDRTGQLKELRADRHDPIIVNMSLNAGSAPLGFTRLQGRSGGRWVYSYSHNLG
jgi:hypothetical protein